MAQPPPPHRHPPGDQPTPPAAGKSSPPTAGKSSPPTAGEPLVSVIIPTHNRPHRLGAALQSVLAQTYSHLEVLVVDDGSTEPVDDTVESAAHGDRRVEVIRLDPNRGAAGARNVGLERASGDFIAFLDDDDRWDPDKIFRQVVYLSAHPAVGFVSCGHRIVHEGAAGPSTSRAPTTFRRLSTHRPPTTFRGPSTFDAEQLLWVNFVGSFSFVMVRRSAVAEELHIDEAFQCAEDWDLWLRCARLAPPAVIPEPLASYVSHHEARLTYPAVKQRGLQLFEDKHGASMAAACRAFHHAHQRMDTGTGVTKRLHVAAAIASAPNSIRRLLVREQVARQWGRLHHDPGLAERTLARLVPSGAPPDPPGQPVA